MPREPPTQSLPTQPLPKARPENTATVDDEFSLAIQLSLQEKELEEKRRRDGQAIIQAEEEAQLAAALAASVSNQPRASAEGQLPVHKAITLIERDNLHLFSRLLDTLSAAGQKPTEPELTRLANDINAVGMKVEEAVLAAGSTMDRAVRADLQRVKRLVDEALAKYQFLLHGSLAVSPAGHAPPKPQDGYVERPSAEGERRDEIKDLLGL